MNIFTYPKFEGNQRVMKRFSDLDYTPEQIAKKFQDKGIKITSDSVRAALNGENEELSRKSFPKSDVKAIENEVKALENAINTL